MLANLALCWREKGRNHLKFVEIKTRLLIRASEAEVTFSESFDSLILTCGGSTLVCTKQT